MQASYIYRAYTLHDLRSINVFPTWQCYIKSRLYGVDNVLKKSRTPYHRILKEKSRKDTTQS